MGNRVTKRVLLCLAALACLCAVRAADLDELDLKSGRVLAIVGDKVITTVDVAAQLKDAPVDKKLSPAEQKAQLNKLAIDVLDHLIDSELVYMDFKERKGKVPPAYLQSRIDRIVVAQANGDEEKFRDFLHANNMTYSEFLEQVRQSTAVEMMVYDRTRRYVSVTDQQVRDYFNAHGDDFSSKPAYRPQVIMLRHDGRYEGKVAETAGEILQKYADGADFGELAKEYSDGMNEAEGGDMGWVTELAPAFQEIVAGLKAGEIYQGQLTLGKATYLVRLADFRPGKKPVLDEETFGRIREILVDQAAAEKYKAYIKRLYLKFPVRRMVPTREEAEK